MAFKIWQIGLHLQRARSGSGCYCAGRKRMLFATLVAVARGARHYRRWRIVDAQRLAKTLLPWSRELPQRHHICWRFRQSHIMTVISAPVDVPR